MIVKDGRHILAPEWDTDVTQGKLDVTRKTVLNKSGCAKTCRRTKVWSSKGKNAFCTNLSACKDYTNRVSKSQSHVRSDKIINDQIGDDSSLGVSWAKENDELDISDCNLELMDLLSDEDNGDDVKVDETDFLLN